MIFLRQDGSTSAAEAHLRLLSQGSATKGFTGCNNVHGTYEADGARLSFPSLAVTEMHCPGMMKRERAFLDVLGLTDRYQITGETLALYSGDELLAQLESVYF